jgi:hypothetical protein
LLRVRSRTSGSKGLFFAMIAGVALVAGVVILAFDRPLRNVIKD